MVDPNIKKKADDIRNKIYGKEVRESLASGLEAMSTDVVDTVSRQGNVESQFQNVIENTTDKDVISAPEIIAARNGEANLKTRIDKDHQEVTAQLAQTEQVITAQIAQTETKKVDKDGSQQVKWANIAQDAREQISGDKVAVVGKDSVGTENLTENAVTYDKTEFADEVAVRVENLIKNGNFTVDSDGDGFADGWSARGANVTNPRVENNTQYWTPLSSSSAGALQSEAGNPTIAGNQYYISFEGNSPYQMFLSTTGHRVSSFTEGGRHSIIYTPSVDLDDRLIFYWLNPNEEASLRNVMMVDLTEAFGKGNEPDIDYFEHTLKTVNGSYWFDGVLNLTDVRKNGIVTARDLKLYDFDEEVNAKNVDDALIGLSKNMDSALKVELSDNLYNPNNNLVGNVERNSIDGTLVPDGDEKYVSQRIKLVADSDITVRGIRGYTITDNKDKLIQSQVLIPISDTHTIVYDSLPSGSYYLWVTTYTHTKYPQVELGDSLHSYEPFGEVKGISYKNENLFTVPVKDGDVQALHQTSLLKLENDRLENEIEVLKSNSNALFNIRMDKETEQTEITVNNTGKQKLILHLHKRENDGYDTTNDVFLPTAENDFSDIKISDGNGNVLPYTVTYQTSEFDVVADSRLNGREKEQDSYGNLIGVDSNYIARSSDVGRTWDRINALNEFRDADVNIVTQDDTLIFQYNSRLYRSEAPYDSYSEVFTLPAGYSDMQVRPEAMVQHPDGEIFFGTYQAEHAILFYKSTDDGRTWTKIFEELGTYQHTHAMHVDVHVNPIAIYAAVDRGGGVFKTTDKGQTWVDLREINPDIPGATDFGVLYSDPSGYRLLGGETAVTGGHSILKTTDDVNFKPILSTGASILALYKMGDKLFAGGAGTNAYRQGTIYMSEDEGETWVSVYNTSPLIDSAGTNDGYRRMTQLDTQLIASIQGRASSLRILPQGNYAEILVDVTSETDKIIVETGYVYPKKQPFFNDSHSLGDYLVNFNFNEGGRVIKELVSGRYFEGDFEWTLGGKVLSYFYPYITSPNENKSVLMKSLDGYKVDSSNFDISEGITISFWGRIGYDTNIELFRTDTGYSLELFNGSRLRRDDIILVNVNDPIIPDRFKKIDWVISSDGIMTEYHNGQFRGIAIERREGAVEEIMTEIQNSKEMTFFNYLEGDEKDAIQHFSIRKGTVSSEQLLDEFNSRVTDNIIR